MADTPEIPCLPELVPLDQRERRLVSAIIDGQSDTQALRTAGYAESTVRRGAGQFLSRPHIQSAIAAAMTAAGINPRLLAQTMRRGLAAKSPLTVITTKDGTRIERGGGPDWTNRHRFLETALRIGGHEPAKLESHEESYEEAIIRMRTEMGDK